MNATEANNIVSWTAFKGRQSYQRNICPQMLEDRGITISQKEGLSFALVNFDKAYVLSYIRNKFIKALNNPELTVLIGLLEEAHRLGSNE